MHAKLESEGQRAGWRGISLLSRIENAKKKILQSHFILISATTKLFSTNKSQSEHTKKCLQAYFVDLTTEYISFTLQNKPTWQTTSVYWIWHFSPCCQDLLEQTRRIKSCKNRNLLTVLFSRHVLILMSNIYGSRNVQIVYASRKFSWTLTIKVINI